jgi:hypothetical protein
MSRDSSNAYGVALLDPPKPAREAPAGQVPEAPRRHGPPRIREESRRFPGIPRGHGTLQSVVIEG